MNAEEVNMDSLFDEAVYAPENWSARCTKWCDCMTSAAVTIIIYWVFTKCWY